MRRLWPDPGEVDDVAALVAAEARPPHADRPWLLVNMVSSLDGAIAVEGRSGALAGPADKAVFSALRAIADVILVGAGTVRAEGYGPPRPSEATRAARRARGQAEVPQIAIVSRSLDLDVAAPLFAEAAAPPVVVTCAAAPEARRSQLADVAEVAVIGTESVDLAAALRHLAGLGAGLVTCEGGPHLNGDLLTAGLVDEWALTVSPLLTGGFTGRASRGASGPLHAMGLDRLLEDDGFLLGRWVRS